MSCGEDGMSYFQEPIVFGAKHRDEAVRAESRSGGVFTALSDLFLARNGVVYGCVMKNSCEAVHVRAETREERDRMRGSKYIQSNLGTVFRQVKTDVEAGREVLFSGTSCQVAALQRYLREKREKVFYVDIACFGVGSPLVWQDFIHWQEKCRHGRCEEVVFRNKADFGWKSHIATLWIQRREKRKKVSVDVFGYLYNRAEILRPACYQCPYKSAIHPGDVTLADFWGIDRTAPELNDDRGISLALVNTERGEALFREAEAALETVSVRLQDAIQPTMQRPWPKPETRERFWEDYARMDFGGIARKYGDYTLVRRIRKRLGKIKRKYLVRKDRHI